MRQFVFADTNKAVIDAYREELRWKRTPADKWVKFHHGSILDVEADAVLSPANSFGFMDGGIDAVYLKHFGLGLQTSVQSVIYDKWRGELPVGCAEIVATGGVNHRWLVVAPTMRVPGGVGETPNAYLAMRGALTMEMTSYIETLAIPGLGTGCGGMCPKKSARQVKKALENWAFPTNRPWFPRDTNDAFMAHRELCGDQPRSEWRHMGR